MKTVLRICIILAVTLAICAIALVMADNAGIIRVHSQGGGGENLSVEGYQSSGQGSGQGRGYGKGNGGESHSEGDGIGSGTSAWVETIKNLGIAAVFILVVTFVERLVKKSRRARMVSVQK